LLVYAHGLGLSAADHDRELAHAASWGFVTAAPEKAKDVDLVEMAGQLYEAAGDPGNPLNGRIGADEPLVVGGMSQGTGYAATSAAAAPDDVSGVLLVSGGGAPAAGGTGSVPTMILAGGRDPAMASWMEPGFEAAEGPATLVVVEDAGHSSFSAACTSEARASMVGANPEDCAPVEVGEEALWPAIDHTIVAFLRWATGQDGSAAALSEQVVGSLGTSVTVSGDLDS
jgi:pimeloyl-ACP methyl ester carboxylesterase